MTPSLEERTYTKRRVLCAVIRAPEPMSAGYRKLSLRFFWARKVKNSPDAVYDPFGSEGVEVSWQADDRSPEGYDPRIALRPREVDLRLARRLVKLLQWDTNRKELGRESKALVVSFSAPYTYEPVPAGLLRYSLERTSCHGPKVCYLDT